MKGGMQGSCSDNQKLLAPQFFQHRQLMYSFASARTLSRQELINFVNYLHFSDRPVFVLLQHPRYDEFILMKAYHEPCVTDVLTCRWDESYFRYPLADYQLRHLVIPRDQSLVFAPMQSVEETENGTFKVHLPEKSYVLSERGSKRFSSAGVHAELVQNGMIAQGELVDFSSRSFRLRVRHESIEVKNWFNPEVTASVRLSSGRDTIFSGVCRCIRRQENQQSAYLVLTAENGHISRFPPKKIRNPRRQLTPSLTAVFEHPLSKKRMQRNIHDLSTTGFSISDDADDAVLIPGMIIPRLSIVHTGITTANCTAQIIYRRTQEGKTQYGAAILDMDIHAYSRINGLLGAHADPHISVSTEVDMDALWEFFFQTGFIYPSKYGSFQAQRKTFMETYRKLYQENPEIARHIIYEQNGKIYGHMSMAKAYQRTWLIQHHAGRAAENKMPGYVVLRHMIIFLHGAYTLPSAKMDYVMCYFRPENKFPAHVFGGFARELNDPRRCSLDLFSYLTVTVKSGRNSLPDGWSLREVSAAEMWELENLYRRTSGGLFMDILKEPYEPDAESLTQIYARHGFTRKWSLYALFYKDRFVCAIIVNSSDLGVNLSDLLNSVTVMVMEGDVLDEDVLFSAVTQLYADRGVDKVQLLVYPDTFAESKGIPCEKRYNMWIIDMQYSNLFLAFVQRKFRMKYE